MARVVATSTPTAKIVRRRQLGQRVEGMAMPRILTAAEAGGEQAAGSVWASTTMQHDCNRTQMPSDWLWHADMGQRQRIRTQVPLPD